MATLKAGGKSAQKRSRRGKGKTPPKKPKGRTSPGTLNAEMNTQTEIGETVSAREATPGRPISEGDKEPSGELNLEPLGTESGFADFIDDEWRLDEDVTNDLIRPRDPAPQPSAGIEKTRGSSGQFPTPSKKGKKLPSKRAKPRARAARTGRMR